MIYTAFGCSGRSRPKQVALGQAHARSCVFRDVLGGFSARHSDHKCVLVVFAGTAASFFGAQGSHWKRPRRSLLPLPVLLSVSAYTRSFKVQRINKLVATQICVDRRVGFPGCTCFLMDWGTTLSLAGIWYPRSTNGRLTGFLPACGTAS